MPLNINSVFTNSRKTINIPGIAISILAAAAYQPQANAILTYSIFQQGEDVIVNTTGSLVLPQVFLDQNAGIFSDCEINPYCYPVINSSQGTIGSYAGPIGSTTEGTIGYRISGPTLFGFGFFSSRGELLSGPSTLLCGGCNFRMPSISFSPSVVSGGSIESSFAFRNISLSELGIYSNGLIAEWTLQPDDLGDPYTAFDKIRLVIDNPPNNIPKVPGPLGILGGVAAFRFSRKLRKRIKSARRLGGDQGHGLRKQDSGGQGAAIRA